MTPLLLALLLAAPAPAEGPSPARATANFASLLSHNDYPEEALKAEEQGKVQFSLDVGADGRVAACTVTQSSGSAALDSTTCRIVAERARFVPARDSAGKTVSDRVSSSITWKIQQSTATTPEAQAAFDAYMRCLMPLFGPALIDTRMPLTDVAPAAFAACRIPENAVLRAPPSEEERASLHQGILKFMADRRAGKHR